MMFRKYWKWMLFVSLVILVTITVILCAYLIPRVEYSYDPRTDTYYVDDVYGNAKSYVIKNEIKGKPVTKIKEKVFMNKKKLQRIDIGTNIKTIERLCFQGCTSLANIDLSNVEEIGRSAFKDCTSLTNVVVNASYLSGGVFYGCTNLKEVVLNNTVSIGSYALGLTGIENITLPPTLEMVSKDAFYHCSSLKRIVITSNQLNMNDYLKSLSELIVYLE